MCSIHNRSRQLYFDQHMLMFTRPVLLTVLAFMHNASIPVQLGYNASAGDAGPLLSLRIRLSGSRNSIRRSHSLGHVSLLRAVIVS